jgi:hypothetical protein
MKQDRQASEIATKMMFHFVVRPCTTQEWLIAFIVAAQNITNPT